jgi:hypothetical protein
VLQNLPWTFNFKELWETSISYFDNLSMIFYYSNPKWQRCTYTHKRGIVFEHIFAYLM